MFPALTFGSKADTYKILSLFISCDPVALTPMQPQLSFFVSIQGLIATGVLGTSRGLCHMAP